jgi:serine/threonine protein phosphatase PrpC
MEDSHVHKSPMDNSKNSIFGVFDGHGGIPSLTQAQR